MGTSSDTVHGAWLQVHKNCTGYIFALVALIVVNVDAFQLEVHQVLVHTTRVFS